MPRREIIKHEYACFILEKNKIRGLNPMNSQVSELNFGVYVDRRKCNLFFSLIKLA